MDIFNLECFRLGVWISEEDEEPIVLRDWLRLCSGELLIESWIQQPASLNHRHPMWLTNALLTVVISFYALMISNRKASHNA